MLLRLVDCGSKDEWSMPGCFALTNESGYFDSVTDVPIEVKNQQGEFVIQPESQCMETRFRADKTLFEISQDCFESNEVFDVVVNEQNAHLVFVHTTVL